MVSLREHSVRIPAGSAEIEGVLVLPAAPIGLVLFAHGSGSSRFSPRNVHVARALHARGIGTLLLDLLTLEEDSDYLARFDIALLAGRLDAATRWASGQPLTHGLPVGYFGASTGAAAALEAAARQGADLRAVVSRGGRPDLASGEALARVACPTLLLVGSRDTEVLALNRQAASHLRCMHHLSVVRGATISSRNQAPWTWWPSRPQTGLPCTCLRRRAWGAEGAEPVRRAGVPRRLRSVASRGMTKHTGLTPDF